MIFALTFGALFGYGVYLGSQLFFPIRTPLAIAIDRVHTPYAVPKSFVETVQVSLRRSAMAIGLGRLLPSSASKDLRVVGKTLDQYLGECLLVGLLGLAIGPLMALVFWTVKVTPPMALLIWTSLAFGVAGFAAASMSLAGEADKRRRAFRHAFSAYLDVMSISLSAGNGVEEALERAASVGDGWTFQEIRHCVVSSRVQRQPLWRGLDDLGDELAIAELREFAGSVRLSTAAGARMRSSLATKAQALRERLLTDSEVTARAASERMQLPITLLAFGYIGFLGYPAVARVMSIY